jgi:hypothetical protein
MTTPKPGVQSSEFWISALAVVIPLLLQLNVIPHQSEALAVVYSIASLLAAFGYTAARTYLKALNIPTPTTTTTTIATPAQITLQYPVNVPANTIPQSSSSPLLINAIPPMTTQSITAPVTTSANPTGGV